MYYLLPDYYAIQPTFVYFPTIFSNYITTPVPQIEIEITQNIKKSSFNQNDQLSLHNMHLFEDKLPIEQHQKDESLKYRKLHEKLQIQKIESKSTDNYKEVIKLQKSHTKKRKTSSKLCFDVEWKNQNRNIIPNIMNQMLSFIEKKHKSQYLTIKLFKKYQHAEQWTIPKYYCYMKRIKSSMGHYINQNQLETITVIQEPQYQIYSSQQQLFYLKICRISLEYFFKTESILISLTSKRMSQEKRKAHLVARRALLLRVQQIMTQHSQ